MSGKSKQPKHHTESSKSHDARKKHDRKARAHNEDVYAGGSGMSSSMKWGITAVAVIVVVTLTVMFIAGLIEW